MQEKSNMRTKAHIITVTYSVTNILFTKHNICNDERKKCNQLTFERRMTSKDVTQ